MNIQEKIKKLDDQAIVKLYIEQSIDESSCFELVDALAVEIESRFTESAVIEIESRIESVLTK